jgi:RNA polymerase sigma-70 factor (ECF subfamily)
MSERDVQPTTRPSLLCRLRSTRDEEAWQTFVAIYAPLVHGSCRRRGLQHVDAEDVTQRVFTRILAAIQSFEYQPERGRFRDWLGTIVHNEIRRFARDKRTVTETDLSPTGTILEGQEARVEDSAWTEEFNAHLLRTALDRARPHFAEQTWRAFELVWLDHHPAPQVAETLALTLDSIYVAKFRVLQRLAQEVQELASDEALALLNEPPGKL